MLLCVFLQVNLINLMSFGGCFVFLCCYLVYLCGHFVSLLSHFFLFVVILQFYVVSFVSLFCSSLLLLSISLLLFMSLSRVVVVCVMSLYLFLCLVAVVFRLCCLTPCGLSACAQCAHSIIHPWLKRCVWHMLTNKCMSSDLKRLFEKVKGVHSKQEWLIAQI